MKSLITLVAVATLAMQSASAQNLTAEAEKPYDLQAKNSWYVEFGGAAALGISINYERFLEGHPWGISIHAGIGGGFYTNLFSTDDNLHFYGAIPVGVSYNVPVTPNKRNLIEIGATYSFMPGFNIGGNINADQALNLLQGQISWRFESATHTTHFRASLYPVVENTSNHASAIRPWIGFSIGKKF
jgi:opacity protein-like surface antigen